ncbi:TIGR01440 family protein [Alteribacter natronophilus]|uniref:TIGR01440 family protein n=1 Tax=Alteribacter natronophilus TaxID=2583810 RepID=UPI00110E7358|nr:TIGR01440 family protein [Alteribacter natronophilus]TMW72159.1 TIGR01440 family protein [Alteribacter natronophilus]
MSLETTTLTEDLSSALADLQEQASFRPGQILAVGTSTSEVKGERIGTAGATEIAAALWEALESFRQNTGIHLAFQCCEHLNRALVIEESAASEWRLENQVSAVPVPKAGGSMAAYAYRHMKNPVVLEDIKAHGGIDIGDTLIGMHLRPVAVPVRSRIKAIGAAHLTLARTRPKLIGGERAVYQSPTDGTFCE